MKISLLKNNFKMHYMKFGNYNKSLHTDVDSATLRPRR